MPFATIDGLEVDALINEDHSLECETTDNPVEEGSDFTDHVRIKPRMFSCDGVISDTPLGPMLAIRDAQGGGRPSEIARAKFEAIIEARKRITVVTARKRYDNMIMLSVSMPENIGIGEACRFRATFKQIRVVKNERTTIVVAVPRAAKKQARGNKPAKPANPSKKTYTGVSRYKDSWGGQLAQKLGALDGFGSGTEFVED